MADRRTGVPGRPAASRLGALAAAGLAAAALCATALVGGCASDSARRDSELALIDQWLPGRYDNQAQIAADSRAGRPLHEALALTVVPVDALQMGHHVFYVEESAGRAQPPGAPRLIVAQHLASIDVVNGRIIAALYSFTDPPRWREGATTPELFSALQPQDVKRMRGCELTFAEPPVHAAGRRHPPADHAAADQPGSAGTGAAAADAQAGTIRGSDDPAECHTTSPLTGALEPMPIRIELTRDEIAVSVQTGSAPPVPAEDAYTRFRRSGGP